MDYRAVQWDAPINLARELKAIPKGVSITGALIGQTAVAARSLGVGRQVLRAHYAAHQRYPLSEHVTLLTEIIPAAYPDRPPRLALRSMGRVAVSVYLESLVGRVTVGSTNDVEVMLQNVAHSYELNISGVHARVLSFRPGQAEILLEHVPYFIDSHHVGILEGCLKRCGVRPVIEVAVMASDTAAFRCSF